MNECRIIEDLLPLYVDGLLQEDTNEFVKLHLVRCKACSEKEKRLRANLSVPPPAPDRKGKFRRVSRKVKIKAALLSVVSVVLALGIAFGTYETVNYFRREAYWKETSFSRIEYYLEKSNDNRVSFGKNVWEITQQQSEGARVRNGNVALRLPDESFIRLDDGRFARYEYIPDLGESLFTDTLSFSMEQNQSDFISVPDFKDYINRYSISSEYCERGRQVLEKRGVRDRMALFDYLWDFDFDAITLDSSKDDIAVALFLATCKHIIFEPQASVTRLSGDLTGYCVYTRQEDARNWHVYIKNPSDTRTYYDINLRAGEYYYRSETPWRCRDENVQDLLASVQIL